jgi:hypothetical protein
MFQTVLCSAFECKAGCEYLIKAFDNGDDRLEQKVLAIKPILEKFN